MISLIMAGGGGTRFWPLSRESHPKQFLQVTGGQSMLQLTYKRLLTVSQPQDIYVVTAGQQATLVKQHLPQLPAQNIISEPFGRNTAPAIGLALAWLQKFYPANTPMLTVPADHIITDKQAFTASVKQATDAANTGQLVTFGITPTFAATGYGYIKTGQQTTAGVYTVDSFKEKPDLPTAQSFLASGNYLWNSGMFVWQLGVLRTAFATLLPRVNQLLQQIETTWQQAADAPIDDTYGQMPKIPVDIGIMEQATNRCVIPVSYYWNDVGSFTALHQMLSKDEQGNSFNQPALAINAGNNYVNTKVFTALAGVDNLIIVQTDDAILVCSHSHAQKVKDVYAWLQKNRTDLA